MYFEYELNTFLNSAIERSWESFAEATKEQARLSYAKHVASLRHAQELRISHLFSSLLNS